jgi:alkylated DNA nucleotide flippase Atl1
MDSTKTSKYTRIYDVVRRIPWGKVATYGQVADLAGLYGKARLVGYALYQVPLESDVPWQRVVNARGRSPIPSPVKVATTCKEICWSRRESSSKRMGRSI